MIGRRFCALGAAALLMLAGCGQRREDRATKAASPCGAERFEGAEFVTCTVARGDGEVRIVSDDADGRPLRSFAALDRFLGRDRERLRFAMNAGMFDANGRPIGLYIANGQLVRPLNRNAGPGNFHLLPNGVFTIDADGFQVRTSDAFARAGASVPLFATQSGPMLVIDGALHPRIATDGTSLNIRNAVGIDRQGRAHFVISNVPVSFGKLARYLRDAKGCRNALFFDGTVSSLWEAASGRQDGHALVGPMIVALAPEQ